MRMTKLAGKTSKKIDGEFNIASQKLLLRSGMFRSVSDGVYSVLPFGSKTMDKLLHLLTRELEQRGFQRVYIPSDKEFEKTASLTLRNDMKSYKDFPISIYDIFISQREKIKIKDGLIKSKRYTNLRTCSFFEDEEALIQGYDDIKNLYKSKLKDMGLNIFTLQSHNEKRAGARAEEFVYSCNRGDRKIFKCEKCRYKAFEEMSDFHIEEIEIDDKEIEAVYTPDIKTIKELEEFLNINSKDLAKTLLIKVKEEILAVVIRGNRELNPYKLASVLDVAVEDIEMAEYEEIDGSLETVPGFVGPVELQGVRIIVDREITKAGSLITGANKKNYHLKNVKYERDFEGDLVADVSYILGEDKCPLCGGTLNKEHGISIGKILNLDKINYIKNMLYKNKEGKPMGIYGISSYMDIYKLISIIVEENHDKDGIIWPLALAPYHVIISILNTKKEDQNSLGERIYNELKNKKIDVIIDDRKERAGAKFYDADLLGIPIRIVVARGSSENKVEFKLRWENEREELDADKAIEKVFNILGIS